MGQSFKQTDQYHLGQDCVTSHRNPIPSQSNSLNAMTKLIMKLPFDLRRKWISQSVFIENQTGQVAEFNDFVVLLRHSVRNIIHCLDGTSFVKERVLSKMITKSVTML